MGSVGVSWTMLASFNRLAGFTLPRVNHQPHDGAPIWSSRHRVNESIWSGRMFSTAVPYIENDFKQTQNKTPANLNKPPCALNGKNKQSVSCCSRSGCQHVDQNHRILCGHQRPSPICLFPTTYQGRRSGIISLPYCTPCCTPCCQWHLARHCFFFSHPAVKACLIATRDSYLYAGAVAAPCYVLTTPVTA